MAADKRKKGCPNESCERHHNKKMLNATEDYCPKCGTKLILVCSKCFNEIEDKGPDHRICSLCDAIKQEKREKAIDGVKKAGKGAAGFVAPMVFGVGRNIEKDIQKTAVNKGKKIVNTIVTKRILKK